MREDTGVVPVRNEKNTAEIPPEESLRNRESGRSAGRGREMTYGTADPGNTPACPGKEGETMHGKKTLICDDNIRISSPIQRGPEERGALPDFISQSIIDSPGDIQRGILQDGFVQ